MPDSRSGAIDDLVRLGESLTEEAPGVRPFIERAVIEARALRSRLRFAEIMNGELDAELGRSQQQADRLRALIDEQADELERRQRAFERVNALVELAEWSRQGSDQTGPITVGIADLRAALTDESSPTR